MGAEDPGPKSKREKEDVCRNGVSTVNFSKCTKNGSSILASASLVTLLLRWESCSLYVNAVRSRVMKDGRSTVRIFFVFLVN